MPPKLQDDSGEEWQTGDGNPAVWIAFGCLGCLGLIVLWVLSLVAVYYFTLHGG